MKEDTVESPELLALLDSALKKSGLSARKAAEQIGLSDTRLRHIINGYQPIGRGQRIDVIAPTDTLANIAIVLKVTPDDLDAAGRSDAADAVRRRLKAEPDTRGRPDYVWSRVLAEQKEIAEWAEDPFTVHPPASILEYFSDDTLLAEVARRIRYGGPVVDIDDPAALASYQERSNITTLWHNNLSEAPDTSEYAEAAYEEETSIAGEQEESDTP